LEARGRPWYKCHMARARPRATYDDALQVPEHMVAEIIDGELYATPRPASPHAFAAAGIGRDLFGPFHREPGGPPAPGGWWILFEPELHLNSDLIVPDLTGWRHEHMARVPSVAYFTQPPDWVCEIVSPTTAATDRVRKMRVYAREQVAHAWLVDPLAKTLEVYRLEQGRWAVAATYSGDERVRAEPFDAIELQLSRWWLQE
jgi:Uma2 family endonuclease